MTSWADAPPQAFNDLDSAPSGTGATLPGQHAVTPEERAKYNKDQFDFNYEEGKKLVDATRGTAHPMDRVTDAMVSAKKIGQASDDKLWGGKEEYLKAAQQQPLGDVNDPAARLKAMSFITQDTPEGKASTKVEGGDGKVDQSVCAGASIVGAAFLANGPDGLKQVMKACEKQDPKGLSTGRTNPEYQKLKEKLAKDPNSLTVADIQSLQKTTYEVLRKNQADDPSILQKPEDTGVHGKTMDNFMKKSPDLAKMFEKNGMQIQGVDIDGKLDDNNRTNMDHWVVKMKGPDGKQAIYDPLARRGGQVIDFDEGVKHYDNATQDTVGD